MLAFTRDWYPKDASWTADTPVCTWAGVGCTAARVTEFKWFKKGCTGTFNGTSLPEKMLFVDLIDNNFNGTPVLDKLPAEMFWLVIGLNNFTGTPDLTSLPQGMETMGLAVNKLTGTPDLTKLPAGLKDLLLFDNAWCGSTGLDISCDVLKLEGTNCTCANATHGGTVTCRAC